VVASITPSAVGERSAPWRASPPGRTSRAVVGARSERPGRPRSRGRAFAGTSFGAVTAFERKMKCGDVTTIRALDAVRVETVLGTTATPTSRLLAASVVPAVLVAAAAGAAILATVGLRAALLAGALVAAAGLAECGCRRPHPVAPVAAAGVVVLAALVTSDPIAVLAAIGLGAAAGVDLAERRIPTTIAYGTTILCVLAAAVRPLAGGRMSVTTSWFSAGVVVAIYACLWLVGGIGFGDVRLVAATVSGAEAGLRYVAAMVTVPVLVLPVIAIGWRLARRRPPVPFGPALVAGWLVALSV
jgi:prepilin signal peptidase PulO-like enzyme (type II secretory pathway)